MAALFLPIFVIITGLVLPFSGGEPGAGYEQIHPIISLWLVRLVLFGILSLAMFHCAHRIRHIIMDLGLRHAGPVLPCVCYGAASVGVVLTAIFLVGVS